VCLSYAITDEEENYRPQLKRFKPPPRRRGSRKDAEEGQSSDPKPKNSGTKRKGKETVAADYDDVPHENLLTVN
jgi:hypothetical protein